MKLNKQHSLRLPIKFYLRMNDFATKIIFLKFGDDVYAFVYVALASIKAEASSNSDADAH